MLRFCILFASLGALCLSGVASAQCNPPGTENFDALVVSSTSYGVASPTVLPPGWTHDLTAPNSWRADFGGTSSSNTGPAVDHTTGGSLAGNMYMYTETSGGTAGVTAHMMVCFDASAVANPTLEFYNHMWNGGTTVGGMGTLMVEQSMDGGLTYPTVLWSQSGDQGNQWNFAKITGIVPDANNEVWIRFTGIRGSSFVSDMAIDDVKFGEPTPLAWEVNTFEASLDVNGRNGDPFIPATVNQVAYQCGAGPVAPVTGSFNWSSSGASNALFETVLDVSPIVGLGSGGIAIPGGMLNLSVASAANWSYLNGGTSLKLRPFAPWSLPGASYADLSVNYAINTQLDLSLQGVFVSSTFATGIRLTQASEFHVSVQPAVASIPGPTSTSTNITIDVSSGATCWAPGGVPFYGTSYSTIYVSPNGFVCFGGGGDTDTSPSILDATNDDGRVGFWTSFDPSEGGVINVTSPALNLIRVDWVGVWYDSGAAAGTNTFSIEIDATTGVILIDGLSGISLNTTGTSTTDDQWLGISPGLTMAATDPGPQPFAAGGSGAALLPTDMLYEFNDVSVTSTGLPPSLIGGMNQLVFSPDGLGNYNWNGL